MQTIDDIIAYLETELAAAHESHDQTTDKNERLFHLASVITITRLLEEIKR